MRKEELLFQRILCAVDFSPASLRAFDVAIGLAAMHGAQVHVLHVIPRIIASVSGAPVTSSAWTVEQEKHAKIELAKLVQRAAKRGVSSDSGIRIGDIDLQILGDVRDTGADLLAMGTHGRRAFKRWALGSVAERMLQFSPIPLLLAASAGKATQTTAIRRILIPTDFSAGTNDAVRYGTAIGSRAGAHITMLHVIDDRSAAVDWKAFPDQTKAVRKKLEDLVDATQGARKVASVVESGVPHRVILKNIEDTKPSLVILNTHGHGFIDRLLIGSTADRLVRSATALCPLLLIPPSGRPGRRRAGKRKPS
jgi:nucleotide-binding universal stress UspA family protein